MQPLDDQPFPLSIHYAFVVRVRTDLKVKTGELAGQVEHIVSGERANFTSVEALVAIIEQMLRQGGETSSSAHAE